jgi:NAD(P)-dependent dehydrogenase (short-subunit alcohol dehydrogenase family)
MARNFAVNTIGPALLLKNLAPLLAPGDHRSVYGKLSARVGSIGDNKLGGWYSYRASKAAINQILHTAALELHRTRPKLAVAALQPGTVIGPLSKRFVGAEKKPGLLMPDESACALLGVMDRIEAKKGAHFVDYEGSSIEW